MFRISLRHLLVLVALLALAIVSLRYASAWWEAIMLCVTSVVFIAMVLVALVGRGPGQAFAIGMAVVMAGYAIVKFHEPANDPPHLGLVTNHLLVNLQAAIHSAIGDVRYVDERGREIAGFDPAKAGAGSRVVGGPGVYVRRNPSMTFFLPIGHCWWALLLGYFGGLFARLVYLPRMKEQPLKT
jgi:hypothetical protein